MEGGMPKGDGWVGRFFWLGEAAIDDRGKKGMTMEDSERNIHIWVVGLVWYETQKRDRGIIVANIFDKTLLIYLLSLFSGSR